MTSSQQPLQESEQALMPGLSIGEIIPVLWTSRKEIVALTLSVTFLVFLINYFVLSPEFTASSTLLPETEQKGIPGMGGMANLATIAGISLPESDMARLYPSIIDSETLLGEVLNREFVSERFDHPVRLAEYFVEEADDPAEAFEKALKQLRNALEASYDPRTNIVTVQAVLHEASLASDVVNAVVGELDSFMKEKRVTSASERRKWIEQRLSDVELELKAAEETLTDFRERNRRVVDSPELLQEQTRLGRSVEISSTVFIELKRQHELARIEELRNIAVVNVLDNARPPVKKSGPRRAVNTAAGFVLSFLTASLYVILRRKYGDGLRERIRQIRSAR